MVAPTAGLHLLTVPCWKIKFHVVKAPKWRWRLWPARYAAPSAGVCASTLLPFHQYCALGIRWSAVGRRYWWRKAAVTGDCIGTNCVARMTGSLESGTSKSGSENSRSDEIEALFFLTIPKFFWLFQVIYPLWYKVVDASCWFYDELHLPESYSSLLIMLLSVFRQAKSFAPCLLSTIPWSYWLSAHKAAVGVPVRREISLFTLAITSHVMFGFLIPRTMTCVAINELQLVRGGDFRGAGLI